MQTTQSEIRWDLLKQPDIAGDAMRAYDEGRRAREERERARLDAQRIAAERDFYRAQTQAAKNQTDQMAPPLAPSNPNYVQKWMTAAQPRMHLFPDFEKTVFAQDVSISPDMVMFMSSSPLAADIAFYLATHKAESLAISKLPPLDAARAVDRIERDLSNQTQTSPPGEQ